MVLFVYGISHLGIEAEKKIRNTNTFVKESYLLPYITNFYTYRLV